MAHHKTKTQKARIETRLQPEEEPEFQIAPMIDILLVLLVFFMSISSTEVLQVNDFVKLPVAKSAKDPRKSEEQVIVNVLWDEISNAGTIEVDGRKYATAADTVPYLTGKVEMRPNSRVLVRADRRVKYEYLRGLLVAAGAAKISNVTFSVVDKEGSETPTSAQ
ncbi:MAG: biopolymer transporter ExbD [Verrucomicrobiota bacterium]|nr:biopolymer transporter ExbD [Verrucomicrobiota bacterium]